MILSNVEIHRALDAKRLIIDPEPLPRLPTPGQPSPYDTHSVDLRLGAKLLIPQRGHGVSPSCWSRRGGGVVRGGGSLLVLPFDTDRFSPLGFQSVCHGTCGGQHGRRLARL
jgi:hypothetical protein